MVEKRIGGRAVDRFKFNWYLYLALMVPIIAFSPPINLGVGPDIRLDDLWLLFGGLAFVTLYLRKKNTLSLSFTKPAVIFFSFICWIGITIVMSIIREPNLYSHSDWLDIYKNLKLLLIFILATSINLDKQQLNNLLKIIGSVIFISALFGIAQYFNIFNINSWVVKYYVNDSQLRNFEIHRRVVSFFRNSNVFAGILFIGIALSFAKLLVKPKLIRFIELIVYFAAMFLTMSRTGLLGVAILVATIFILSLIKYTKKRNIALFGLASLAIPLAVLPFAPDMFFYRISRLGNILNDNSFKARLAGWEEIYVERTSNNIITGTGPVGKLHFYYDNEWLQILTNFGIIGVILVISLFTIIYLNIGRVGKNNQEYLWVSIAAQGLIITYAFYMITLAVFQQLQMMPLIILFLGVVMALNSKNKGESI